MELEYFVLIEEGLDRVKVKEGKLIQKNCLKINGVLLIKYSFIEDFLKKYLNLYMGFHLAD